MEKKKMNFGEKLMASLVRLLGRLPLGFHHACADVIAWFLEKVLHYREKVLVTNIARSFPEMKYDEIKKTAKQFYLHFADIYTEAVWIAACHGEKGLKRIHDSHIVELTNVEEINRFYEKVPSVMLLSSHTGNWELFGGFQEYNYSEEPLLIKKEELTVVYKELHSKLWDRVIEEMRLAPLEESGFCGYLETGNILRYAVQHRNQKLLYYFITDQHPYGNAARFDLEFMHQKTKAMFGGTSLACKFGFGVMYLRWEIVERGKYRMTFVPICEDASKMTPEEVMREFYRLLEEDLNKQPWDYLWTHKRWKS